MVKTTGGKVMDVKGPGKSLLQPTARPIVVGNHPMMTHDPMVVATTTPETAPAIDTEMHGERTIQPITTSSSSETDEPEEQSTPSDTDTKSDAKPELTEDVAAEVDSSNENEGLPAVGPIITQDGGMRDPEAEKTKAEAAALEAEETRLQELEAVIDSGKYAVPIGSQHVQRARLYTGLFIVVIIILIMILLDALLDAGLIKLSSSVPHTHLLSK